MPSVAPTAAVASAGTTIESSTPLAGDGISVSTLSVETSSSGSSTVTLSPTLFSQRVTVPSVTLSPSAGSTIGVAAAVAVCDVGAAGAGAGAGVGVAGAAAGAGAAGTAPASPMIATTPPTATVLSVAATISRSTPLAGDGISVSTLSVETSRSGSSTLTVSPTFLSQRVTVPSVTLSPSAGMVT